jgi:hypothetical protein
MQPIIDFLTYLWLQLLPYITPENFSIVVGAGMPMLIQILNQYVPDSSKYRAAVTWVVSGIIGLLSVLISNKFNPQELVASVALVYAASQVSYRYWFKGSRVETKINAKFQN